MFNDMYIICVCMCVYMHICLYTFVHVWRPEDKLCCLSSGILFTVHPNFCRTGSLIGLKLSKQAKLIDQQAPVIFLFPCLSTTILTAHYHAEFFCTWFLRIEHRPSCLQSMIFPVPSSTFEDVCQHFWPMH